MYHFVVCISSSPWWCHCEPYWLSENFADFHVKGKNIISDNFILSETNLIFQFDKKQFYFNLRVIFYIKNETVSFRFWTAAEISLPGRDSRQCHCNESVINYSFTSINTHRSQEYTRQILCFVARTSLYNRFQMKPKRFTLILSIFISKSLHVSGYYVPIIRRTYCIYATLVFFTLYGWLFDSHL